MRFDKLELGDNLEIRSQGRIAQPQFLFSVRCMASRRPKRIDLEKLCVTLLRQHSRSQFSRLILVSDGELNLKRLRPMLPDVAEVFEVQQSSSQLFRLNNESLRDAVELEIGSDDPKSYQVEVSSYHDLIEPGFDVGWWLEQLDAYRRYIEHGESILYAERTGKLNRLDRKRFSKDLGKKVRAEIMKSLETPYQTHFVPPSGWGVQIRDFTRVKAPAQFVCGLLAGEGYRERVAKLFRVVADHASFGSGTEFTIVSHFPLLIRIVGEYIRSFGGKLNFHDYTYGWNPSISRSQTLEADGIHLDLSRWPYFQVFWSETSGEE